MRGSGWRRPERDLRSPLRAPRPAESRLVPAADDPHLALEAEHADTAGRQEEPSAEAHRLLHPPRGEGAQDVAVGEEGDVAARAEDLVDDAVAARADLVCRLAVRHAVGPQVPVRALRADVGRRDAL